MKAKYPKVTKENFEEFTKKHVKGNYNPVFIGLKMPKNDDEFKEFTSQIYGVELGVECFAYPLQSFGKKEEDKYSCKYSITGTEEREYSKGEIMSLWNKKYGQYDGLKVLLDTCFGKLSCGGVATYHYGQTRSDKKQWERVSRWDGNNELKVFVDQTKTRQEFKSIFGL